MDFIGLPTNYDCDDYENSSIGWNPSEKLKELSEAGARYLIARQVHTINNNVIIGNPIGFVMFQFTFEETMADDDSKIETIYCYEIQLTEEARNKGLGTFLMNTMERIGRYFGMKKSMLTAFKENTAALNFYCNHLGYEIDEISPSRCVDPEYIDDYDYEILSKRYEYRLGS
ncbi:hypothetical protein C2G38_2029636 [Gigaspora rosea]|uniref:N-alpha-acetyltransferase 40 n=1 Tax=Gigaspora rosea TaxID=44941 RepID=A0A397VZ60_9GLOM|nr:hypothetical protein C2G38_2029636 [Gigaspora rosea]